MRGVARGIGHLERSPARLDRLAAREDDQAALRHWRDFAPQPVHGRSVQPACALDQLRRIDEVTRAALVHDDTDAGMPPEDRAGGTGVVEMDVREDQVRHRLQ